MKTSVLLAVQKQSLQSPVSRRLQLRELQGLQRVGMQRSKLQYQFELPPK